MKGYQKKLTMQRGSGYISEYFYNRQVPQNIRGQIKKIGATTREIAFELGISVATVNKARLGTAGEDKMKQIDDYLRIRVRRATKAIY